jgi:hypothetical protein
MDKFDLIRKKLIQSELHDGVGLPTTDLHKRPGLGDSLFYIADYAVY